LDLHVTSRDSDDTGAVSDGYLHIRGQLAKASSLRDKHDVWFIHDFSSDEIRNENVHVMPLHCFFYSAEKWLHDESRRTRIEGLILEPTQNTAGEFRRLGVFNTVGHETTYAFLRTVDRVLEYEEVVNPIDCVFLDKAQTKR
jgi:hypothetical protein